MDSVSVHQYLPDPEDTDLIFNIPSANNTLTSLANQEEASDSDEAPEDVPFSVSKNAALLTFKTEKQTREDAKEQVKKRRQKIEAVLKEQKEDKLKRLESLASKRLPDDLIENISAQPVQDQKIDINQFNEIEESEKTKHHKRFDTEHYVPIKKKNVGATSFNVAVLESQRWKKMFAVKKSHKSLANFRQRELYGKRVNRQPAGAVYKNDVKREAAGLWKRPF